MGSGLGLHVNRQDEKTDLKLTEDITDIVEHFEAVMQKLVMYD